MSTMTEPKKPSRPPKKGGADKEKTDATKKPNRSGKNISVWIAADIHAALEQFREAQRIKPDTTGVVELALMEFLKQEGFWPLKATPPA